MFPKCVVIRFDPRRYICAHCDYRCSRKSDMKNHLKSKKHNLRLVAIEKIRSAKNEFSCQYCDKKYKTRSGLWKHEKKCELSSSTELFPDVSKKRVKSVTEEKETKKGHWVWLQIHAMRDCRFKVWLARHATRDCRDWLVRHAMRDCRLKVWLRRIAGALYAMLPKSEPTPQSSWGWHGRGRRFGFARHVLSLNCFASVLLFCFAFWGCLGLVWGSFGGLVCFARASQKVDSAGRFLGGPQLGFVGSFGARFGVG